MSHHRQEIHLKKDAEIFVEFLLKTEVLKRTEVLLMMI